MLLVESHEALCGPALLTGGLPSVMEVDTGKEVLGLIGIVQSPFFDHRNLRVQGHEDHGKHADAVALGPSFFGRVDLHPLDTTGR